jgi:hypothetical protein
VSTDLSPDRNVSITAASSLQHNTHIDGKRRRRCQMSTEKRTALNACPLTGTSPSLQPPACSTKQALAAHKTNGVR